MAEKKFLSDIKLVSSVIRDTSGNQISLTSDERLAVVNAAGGPATQSNPLVTLQKHNQDLESLRSGIRWRDPVDTLSSTAPSNPQVGDRYLNTTDNKIYTCSVAGDWGTGEVPAENWTVLATDTDEAYTFDADGNKWVMISSGNIPYATTTVAGKVELAEDGEVAAGKAVQGNDSRLLKGYFSQTLNNPTGTVVVTHNLNSTKIFVQAWSEGEAVEVQFAKNSSDPANKLDLSVNGNPTAVEVYIIALP